MTLAFPIILLAIILSAILGPSFTNVILVISLLLWPRFARQIRAETLPVMTTDFFAYARMLDASAPWIWWRHILPQIMPIVIVLATWQVGLVILMESALSYLGVGVPPPLPSWGMMVAEGQDVMRSGWWISLFPGLAILFLVLSTTLLGDWLQKKV